MYVKHNMIGMCRAWWTSQSIRRARYGMCLFADSLC